MANDNKFTEDELKQINTIADTYSALQTELGNLGVQKILVDERIQAIQEREEAIRGEWKTNQTTEKELVKTLSEKYGEGTLDPKTGEFTPVDKK